MLALGKNDFPTNLHLLRFLYLCFHPLMNSEIQKDLEQRNYYKKPDRRSTWKTPWNSTLVPRKLRTRQILSTMSTKKSNAGGLTPLCTNSLQFHFHSNYKVRIFFDLLSFFLAHHRQNSWHRFSPDFHTPIIVLDRMVTVTLSHNYSSGIAGHPRPERPWSIWWLRNGSPPLGTRAVVSIIYGISSFEYFVRSWILPETSKCHFETSTCSYYMRRSR